MRDKTVKIVQWLPIRNCSHKVGSFPYLFFVFIFSVFFSLFLSGCIEANKTTELSKIQTSYGEYIGGFYGFPQSKQDVFEAFQYVGHIEVNDLDIYFFRAYLDEKPYIFSFVQVPPVENAETKLSELEVQLDNDSNYSPEVKESYKKQIRVLYTGQSLGLFEITFDKAEYIRRSQTAQIFDTPSFQNIEPSGSGFDSYNGLKPNAYGLGVHMNRYGQPVTLRPDFGGVYGEQLQIEQDAYGLGIHMDQYGRPVREHPWP